MIHIAFRGLDPSELAKEIIINRLEEAVQAFTDCGKYQIFVSLSREKSSQHLEPDLFALKLKFVGKEVGSFSIESKSSNLYVAARDLSDHLLEQMLGCTRTKTKRVKRK